MSPRDAIEPRFRQPVAADLPLLLEMVAAFHVEDGSPLPPSIVERAVRKVIDGDPLARIWLVEADGRACGYVCLALGFSIEAGGGDFFIDDLYILEDMRGRGLGGKALAFAETAARDLGAERVCLEVERGNPRARALYERLGYAHHPRELMSRRLREE